jgi:hypothetical protein
VGFGQHHCWKASNLEVVACHRRVLAVANVCLTLMGLVRCFGPVCLCDPTNTAGWPSNRRLDASISTARAQGSSRWVSRSPPPPPLGLCASRSRGDRDSGAAVRGWGIDLCRGCPGLGRCRDGLFSPVALLGRLVVLDCWDSAFDKSGIWVRPCLGKHF